MYSFCLITGVIKLMGEDDLLLSGEEEGMGYRGAVVRVSIHFSFYYFTDP